MDRCPGFYGRTPGARDCLRAWGWLKGHGALPVAGGMLDQANTFAEAISVIRAAISEAEDVEERRRGNNK